MKGLQARSCLLVRRASASRELPLCLVMGNLRFCCQKCHVSVAFSDNEAQNARCAVKAAILINFPLLFLAEQPTATLLLRMFLGRRVCQTIVIFYCENVTKSHYHSLLC